MRSKPYSLLNILGGNRINGSQVDGFLILVLLKSYLLAIGYQEQTTTTKPAMWVMRNYLRAVIIPYSSILNN